VRLERGAESLTVDLVPRGGRPFEPPVTSTKYDLFYRSPAPGEVAPGNDEAVAVLKVLADALDAARQ
jgi:hypothetical protein